MIDSAADDRTANNVLRHEYRVLSEEEKLQMKEIKDIGADFIRACRRIGSPLNRELALAVTKIEEATFWAVKFITGERDG